MPTELEEVWHAPRSTLRHKADHICPAGGVSTPWKHANPTDRYGFYHNILVFTNSPSLGEPRWLLDRSTRLVQKWTVDTDQRPEAAGEGL